MKLAKTSSITIIPAIENKSLAKAFTPHLLCLKIILAKLVPREEDLSTWIDQSIPLISAEDYKTAPCILPIHLICPSNNNIQIEKLFLDTLQKDLFFEKSAVITSFLHMPFKFFSKKQSFFYAKAEILIENNSDLTYAYNSISIIETEFLSNLSNQNLELDLKRPQNIPKKALINKDLKKLLEKKPAYIDNNIFSEAARLSILAPFNFENLRSHRHLSRIICSLYLLRKSLRKKIHLNPEKRHLQIRLLLATLFFTFGQKPSLGLSLGLNLFNNKEFLEEEHIESALQKWIRKAQIVKDSFYSYKNPKDQIRTIYLEIEKKDGSKFSLTEIKKLQKNLPEELKIHIETAQTPIFFIPNEEETMRDILHLSLQFKTLSDLPQITLSFFKQTKMNLLFRLVLVRVVKKDTRPLEEILKPHLSFSIERSQTVGFLRKKYPKEVYVLEVTLPKDPSLFRNDSSINVYLARNKILANLTKAIGEVRDYNGGLLVKQMELFSQFKEFFSTYSLINPDLLDDFFYSITPIEAQAVSPLENVTFLFEILLNLKQDPLHADDPYQLVFEEKEEIIFAGILTKNEKIKEYLLPILAKKNIPQKDFINTFIKLDGNHFLGLIYSYVTVDQKNVFKQLIKNNLEKKEEINTLRINCISAPLSLDPRIGGDEYSKILLRALFEGLMRLDKNGKLEYAIAKSVEISKDRKTYTFHLKETYWSNGSKLIAYDFEYAWKKILSPGFNSRFTFIFDIIRNAKQANQGLLTMDKVGIKALSDNILQVELENPVPYFLELTALPLFSPINHQTDEYHPNWPFQEGKKYVCNGPYSLMKSDSFNGFILKKNLLYWEEKLVSVNLIYASNTDLDTAFNLFKKNKLDYIQLPFSFNGTLPKEMLSSNILKTAPVMQSRCLFNTDKFPFHNKKIRQAFNLSINRSELIKELKYDCLPISSILQKTQENRTNKASSIKESLILFEEGLKELKIHKSDLPKITLISTNDKYRENVLLTLKRQWEKILKISIEVKTYDFSLLFKKTESGDFQIAYLGWVSGIKDPSYTLGQFRYKNRTINQTNWESKIFQNYLDQYDREKNFKLRMQVLKKAEELLLEEVPCISILHERYNFIKKSSHEIHHNKINGFLDLKISCKKNQS